VKYFGALAFSALMLTMAAANALTCSSKGGTMHCDCKGQCISRDYGCSCPYGDNHLLDLHQTIVRAGSAGQPRVESEPTQLLPMDKPEIR
jgi:hypothetical protein